MITRWYAERDYNFLAMTDHNVLSDKERWMRVSKIAERGGHQALDKYIKAMGDDWVETRPISGPDSNKDGSEATEPDKEVRLKMLSEYRDKFEKPGEFLLMTGEEISDQVNGFPVHMNATNLAKLIRPAGGKSVVEAMTNNLRTAAEQSKKENRKILVHLNHPNFGWAVTAEDLAAVTLERFFEVYNGHPSVTPLEA